jgi:hypothetical protein
MGADRWDQSRYSHPGHLEGTNIEKGRNYTKYYYQKLQLFKKNVLFYPEGSGAISLEPLKCTFVSRSSGFLPLKIFWWCPLGSS